jgi:hypothetical protein
MGYGLCFGLFGCGVGLVRVHEFGDSLAGPRVGLGFAVFPLSPFFPHVSKSQIFHALLSHKIFFISALLCKLRYTTAEYT